ncbi:CaiB/BaiF CoA transferase family protein [Yinghuangia sp. YIM S09857]|uniref:CaiB/BaiF CoA transferase family protein n=1 Tax=Yinghuangia sp. YIM S09857 TaxID=3436929 RepID=UPI003F52D78B
MSGDEGPGCGEDARESSLPLAGLRVVEFAGGVAAAYCAKLLGDAGADVVQVETDAAALARGREPMWHYLDEGKRSVAAAADTGPIDRLVEWADVIVGAVRPDGTLPGGADVAKLRAANPCCVVVTVSPFGTTGPWAGLPGNDFTLQAWGGSSGRRGDAESGPLAVGGETTDWASGVVAAVGALGVLLTADASGRGDHVDVSMLEVATLVFNSFMAVADQLAPEPVPPGPPRLYTELPSVVRTSDGWVGFATNSAPQFRAFADMVGHPEWADHPEYSRANRRGLHAAELGPEIDAWARTRTTAEVAAEARRRKIPVAPVGNGRDTPEFDHMRARGSFVPHPGLGFLRPVVPYRIAGLAPRPPREAPERGAHTEEFRTVGDSLPSVAPVAADTDAVPGDGPAPPLPLDGLRVFDFTSYWAGPCVTQILAWLGADVVKLESTQRPDGTRLSSAYATSDDRPWERAPLFHSVNTGKRGITLDLTRPEGVSLARRLLDVCDIFIENYSPRVVERFGLLPEPGERQDLIVARMPAWGLTGPWRDQPGFAQNMEQAAGLAYITGHPDGPPMVPRGVCDPLGGLHAAFAVLAAIRLRRTTGRGLRIEAPLMDAALSVTAQQVAEWSANGVLTERRGNRSASAAPQGAYRCGADGGYLALSVEDDGQWQQLVALLGHPAWAVPDELAYAEARHTAHDRLDAWLAEVLRTRERAATVGELLRLGVPAAEVVPAERSGDNPQLRARGFFREVDHEVAGRLELPLFPARWANGDEPRHRSPAPQLGEHNADVLGGLLGLTDAELAALEEAGIIGTRPDGR